MAVVDGEGIPLGLLVEAANKSEFKLAEPVLATIRVKGGRGKPKNRPQVLVGDKGYDSKDLRRELKRRGIKPVIPHRWHKDLKEAEEIKQYKQRWHVERTFAWLGNCKRLLVRFERLISMFLGLFYLSAALICLRKLVSG